MFELFLMFAGFFVANHILVDFLVDAKLEKIAKEKESADGTVVN